MASLLLAFVFLRGALPSCAAPFPVCAPHLLPVPPTPNAGGKAKPLTKPKAAAKDYSEEDKAFLEKKKAEEKAIKEAAAKLAGKKK